MLKRLINSLKRNLRIPFLMAEQAAPEKRPRDGYSKGKKEWKKRKVLKPDPEAKEDRKRKVALLIAYNGKGYYGLQINPGLPTVESDLCKALLNVGVIPQDHHDKMQKMSFQRAARTDKGVSAASNIVSLKIRLLMLIASIIFFYMLVNVDNLVEKINEQLPPQVRVMGYKRTAKGFNSKNYCDGRTYIYLLPTLAFAPIEEIVTRSYRTTPEVMANVNRILKLYLGTHPFHNFSSGFKAEERTASRYVSDIWCGEPFIREDVEFAIISVTGQSFILHQIRKMIGLCIAIVKGYCGEETVDMAWNSEKVDIPITPGLGLVLEKLHYDRYNKRFGGDGVHEALEWSNVQDKIDEFKEEKIFTEIIKTELEENVMMNWISKLQFHSFSTKNHFWYKHKTLGKVLGKGKDENDESPATEGEHSGCDQDMDSDEQPKTDIATNLTDVSTDDTVVDEKMAETESEMDTNKTVNEHVAADNHSLKVDSDDIDLERKVGSDSDTVEKLDDDVAKKDIKRSVENS